MRLFLVGTQGDTQTLTKSIRVATAGTRMPTIISQSLGVYKTRFALRSAETKRKGRFAIRRDIGLTFRIGVRFHVAFGRVADALQME